jgi:hypothetical protein
MKTILMAALVVVLLAGAALWLVPRTTEIWSNGPGIDLIESTQTNSLCGLALEGSDPRCEPR